MIEKPKLEEKKIITCLRESFGISVSEIDFLPVGNDSNSWLYRVNTDTVKYFLKIKKGIIYEPSVAVPHYLKDEGIDQVVAPIPTKSGELWEKADNFTLILYPFIDGETGMKVGMSEKQWMEFGTVLKKIHASKLSSELASQVKKENFSPKWSGLVKELQTKIDSDQFTDSFQKELASFWKEKNEEIKKIINRMEELGRLLQNQSLDFVLCHTDIHTANILLDKEDKMFIVDWDNPLLAPKERDLMFIIGTKEEQLFFSGYGKSEINPVALSYYLYEWVAQEIGDYGERVFLNNDVGEETKKDAVKSFVELFQPDNVVESAYKSEPKTNYTEFSDPRLVALYDILNPFGDDSEFFCKQAEKLSAKNIIDLGCGTGLLTVELAKRGYKMTGIEPSEAMLAIAKAKPYADQVKWIRGSFEQMGGLQTDMVLMTSHVAQFFLDEKDWRAMLQAAHKSLNVGGHLVFDIRRLSNPPFTGWPTENNRRKFENTTAGAVEWWFKLLGVENKRVRYELHYFFARSGEKVVSINELVFRSQDEITEALSGEGFETKMIYGDWDESGANPTSPEMIFVAERV